MASVPQSHPGLGELRAIAGEGEGYRLSHASEASRLAATQLSAVIGPWAPIIDFYLDALSYAPANHLDLLRHRGTRIVFAPTVDAALTSVWAAKRRGRQLDAAEAKEIRIRYGPDACVAGAFDQVLDLLIYPSGYRTADLDQVTLHELGHALTLPRAHIRASLLNDLPRAIRNHALADHYRGATAEETLKIRVNEALAEGYMHLISGRGDQLPDALLSELIFILQSVEEGDYIRFEFEDTGDGPRTSSRVSRREIIDASDPDEGHLFADLRVAADAEAWDLAADELSLRRRRRRSA
jgi:hypothetical protein